MLIIWVVLIIPWFLWAGLSGMAFDGGYTAEAYTFVWSVWTYPISVLIAAVLRRWRPEFVLLPILNFVGCGIANMLH